MENEMFKQNFQESEDIFANTEENMEVGKSSLMEVNTEQNEPSLETDEDNIENKEVTNENDKEKGEVTNESLNESSLEIETNEETSEQIDNLNESTKSDKGEDNKIFKLPIARVKNIMKLDPDCTIVSADAVKVTCKAAELFLTHLGSVIGKQTLATKRKTVLKRDFETAINSDVRMCFLDGTLE